MTTKAERAELRKEIGRAGRAELLKLLADAWLELDDLDDAVTMLSDRVCFSCLSIEHSGHQHEEMAMHGAPFPNGEEQPAAVQDGSEVPAQTERGSAARGESSNGAPGE